MRRQLGRRGLTLLEIQVSLVLLLLVTLYLMSLFASGSRHAARALDYSRATHLARQRLELARRTPVDDIVTGLQRSDDPNPGFNTTLTVTPSGPLLTMLEVQARAPSGAVSTCSLLVDDPSRVRGVACDPFTQKVAWTRGSDLRIWDDLAHTETVPPGSSRRDGPVAGAAGAGFLWRGDRALTPQALKDASWDAELPNPVPAPDATSSAPRWSAGVSDAYTSASLWSDTSNRCLWHHDGSAWSALKPTGLRLGRPAGLAADPALSLVWVADFDNSCLRKLVSRSSADATGTAGSLEPAGTFGYWDPRRFRPSPASHIAMGAPRGIAMDPQGSAVFVHDGCRLYRFDEARNEWKVWCDLDAAMVREGVSGMAADRFGSTLFFATLSGTTLWKTRLTGFTPAVLTFTPVQP